MNVIGNEFGLTVEEVIDIVADMSAFIVKNKDSSGIDDRRITKYIISKFKSNPMKLGIACLLFGRIGQEHVIIEKGKVGFMQNLFGIDGDGKSIEEVKQMLTDKFTQDYLDHINEEDEWDYNF